ncbi:unnamed protein product, partial [Prunus brigantina]
KQGKHCCQLVLLSTLNFLCFWFLKNFSWCFFHTLDCSNQRDSANKKGWKFPANGEHNNGGCSVTGLQQ